MTQTKAILTGKRCQCSACGEVFSTSSNFDRHRKGEHGPQRHCIDPLTVGLEIKTNSKGTFFGMPGRVAQ